MQTFRHLTPAARFFQGSTSLEHLGRELDRLGSRRAVIFCGSSLSRADALALVRDSIGERCAGVYTGVRANSPLPAVKEAAAQLERLKADAVIAVGGGSPIVTARAASILWAEKADIRELCTAPIPGGGLHSPKLNASKIPQLVVPTTPTTAIIKAGSAVLDPANGSRLALYDPKTRAQAVFIHPDLISTAPRQLFASAGVNTLTLAVEGLMSSVGDPISDALLIHAVRMLAERLPQSGQIDDSAMRADLIMASILCGQGSDHTGAGIAIPLGHAIGARYQIDMGLTDAVVLPHVLRFNAQASPAGIRKLGAAFGISGLDDEPLLEVVIGGLEKIFTDLGLARRLRDIGITQDAFPDLAAVTMDDWYLKNNPRPVNAASELEQLLQQAW